MKRLSPLQELVIEELQRRGSILVAEFAAENWKRGKSYYLDPRFRCPRWLRGLFRQANGAPVRTKRKEVR